MDIYYKREVGVGFLVIVGLVLFFAGLSWLQGRDFGTALTQRITVQMDDVSGLKEGDPVYISGVPVGQVLSVSLRGQGDVVVELGVSRNSAPHADASIEISALDFFGAQKVDYFPGNSPTMLEPGQAIVGRREVQIMSTAASLADQATEVLTGLQTVLSEETTTSLQQTLDAARAALEMIAGLDDSRLMRNTTATMETMGDLAVRLDSIAANPAVDRSVERLDAITEGLSEMTEGLSGVSDALNSILAKIDSGQGSLGQAVNDTTLTHDVHEVMNSLQLLLDDIRERPQRYIHVKASIF